MSDRFCILKQDIFDVVNRLDNIEVKPKKRLLELFSGTHSIGKVAEKMGYDVTSLDMELPSHCVLGSGFVSKNHIQANIMEWDYKVYPRGYFHVVTASPVCKWWSRLRATCLGKPRKEGGIWTQEHLDYDLEHMGKPMVDKVIEIINYFNPKFYWIENPQTGKMKDYMPTKFIKKLTGIKIKNGKTFRIFKHLPIPYTDVDYCKYSDWGYQKRTRIWTNINYTGKLCSRSCPCENMVRHTTSTGRTSWKHAQQLGRYKTDKTTKFERYRIPEKLIFELLLACE